MPLPMHYQLALGQIGNREIAGKVHNGEIIQMFRDVGHSQVDNDETAWCAAAVGSWLERAGIPSTGALNARSYLDWGEEVGTREDLSQCQPGDVVVFWRESPNSWKGHVALYSEHFDSTISVLGGNQDNAVSFKSYPRNQILSVRRANPNRGGNQPDSKFTEGLLRQIARRGANHIMEPLPGLLNRHLPKYGITSPRRIALFMANIMVETGGLKTLEENLNYSARRLTQVWPRRFPTLEAAKPYANNPEGLANLVYDRYGNRGHGGWGWRYRGRGFMMTTFVDNYVQVKQATGIDVVSNPSKLLDVETALIAACVYWKSRGCNELADSGDVKECRRRINGGLHGLSHVRTYYKKILPLASDLDLSSTNVKFGAGGAAALVGGGAVAEQTGGSWLIPVVALGIFIAFAAFLAMRSSRRKRDVQEALRSTEGSEDVPDQLVLDLAVGGYMARARPAEFPDDEQHRPAPA